MHVSKEQFEQKPKKIVNLRPTLTKHVVLADKPVSRVCGRKKKVFLIVRQVMGSDSDITHNRLRRVFGELLAGYLSWLSIPLLSLGLCVGND